MGLSCSQNGGRKESFQNFNGKPTRKRPPGRPRHRWEDNIKEIYIDTRDSVDSYQDRDYWRVLVNAGLNLRVP